MAASSRQVLGHLSFSLPMLYLSSTDFVRRKSDVFDARVERNGDVPSDVHV
jgi:hypothetical protein